jgi:WD40 repeat protein
VAPSSTPPPEDLTISPATLSQLRLLWTIDEPGNPNAESDCQDVACWRFSRIGGFAFSPDDQTLAVGVCTVDPTENTTNPRHYRFNCDGPSEVRLYDSDTGELLQTLPVGDYPLSLAFHPDGRHLAIGMAHRSIEVWDLASAEKVQTLLHSTTRTGVFRVAFSPDGALLVSSGDSRLQLWDWARGLPQGIIENVSSFSIDPAGGKLATLFWSERGDYAEARFYPFDDLDHFRAFPIDWRLSPYAVAYPPDGSRLVVFGDGTIALLDPSSGDISGETDLLDLLAPGQQGSLDSTGQFTPDGHLILQASQWDADDFLSGLALWTPTDAGALAAWLPEFPEGKSTLRVGPAGRFLITAHSPVLLGVWGIDPTAPAEEPTCLGTCSS